MTVIDEYLRLADRWGEMIDKGDSERANLLHDQIQLLFQELHDRGQESGLFDRADSSSDAARFFIASHLKEWQPSRALALYQPLTNSSNSVIAMSAAQIVKEMKQ